jgi:metal-responsive CopG/Arc/MetJ family transcriptional regulator
MPNHPAPSTVTVSFTLPKRLLEAIESEARLNMTSKSDVIRRALINYLSPPERNQVLRDVVSSAKARETAAPSTKGRKPRQPAGES